MKQRKQTDQTDYQLMHRSPVIAAKNLTLIQPELLSEQTLSVSSQDHKCQQGIGLQTPPTNIHSRRDEQSREKSSNEPF